ncbi:MAG: dienelactone hydrolase family protein [Proteobacteria bacterium]|nr:dienelactone hydrolase family protein [Pseudomonadota bacterium]
MSEGRRIHERAVRYSVDGVEHEGFFALPEGATRENPAPGILVIHYWLGVTSETKSKVSALAREGYAAFAVDVFGIPSHPKSREEAGAQIGLYKQDRALFRTKLNAGLDLLAGMEGVDASRLAATGYCFGGTGAIELARSGAAVKGVAIKGVVSFHGGLDSPDPSAGKNIHCKVLAFHGADDPFVPAADLAAFENEMREHKVDWQLVKFGGVVHSFTNPEAGNDPSKGTAYDARADRRSWQGMKDFFFEIFKQ